MEWTADRIREFRQETGMSQMDFAEWVCVRQATVSEWENGRKPPSPMACRLLSILKEQHDAKKKKSSRAKRTK